MKKKRNLRILWQSNHPKASSGYSQQTQDLEKKFVESGWDGTNFALSNMFGQVGIVYKDEYGIPNYPLLDHVVGSDAALQHGKHFGADIIITLQDVWTMNPQDLMQLPRFIPWMPVDYDPVPKMLLGNARFANRIIAMSKFGQQQLKENGFSSTYIPHHVDTNIFKPMDKKQRKIDLRIDPSTFIFGMVAANKDLFPRKSFGQVLEAFQAFHAKHPKSLLYIHTDPEQPGGYPLKAHADYLGLSNAVAFPEKYKWRLHTPKEEMNMIYNTMDVLLAPSSTEGFMIPAIEAQATGTPVIVNRYTSMPELVIENKTGFITELGCQHFMPIGGYMKFPSVNSLYSKMEMAYSSNLIDMGRNGRKFVEENFSLEKVWNNNWLPFLENIEREIYPVETPTKTA